MRLHASMHDAKHAGRSPHCLRHAVANSICAALLLLTVATAYGNEGVEGVRGDIRRESVVKNFIPADKLEAAAAEQYQQRVEEARSKKTLLPARHPQALRLQAIATRLIRYAPAWNARAKEWRWEVTLVDDPQLNANCMPGGKIMFYSGLLAALQLTDDEVAVVMGHEVAHALREHGRAQLAKKFATKLGIGAISSAMHMGAGGSKVLETGAGLLSLKFSRSDETEADLVGLELAARAGYDPTAGTTLWRKMEQASSGSGHPPELLSTHPAGERRIQQIELVLPKVLPLFEQSEKPAQRYAPPPTATVGH